MGAISDTRIENGNTQMAEGGGVYIYKPIQRSPNGRLWADILSTKNKPAQSLSLGDLWMGL